jgi:glycine/D-amino acid oxidase-like deaminating enzyme
MLDRNHPGERSLVVVGGGVVGLACAIAAQNAGLAVTIVAPADDMAAASWGNAGHIAVEQVEPLASPAMLRSVARRLFFRGGALSLPPREIATWMPFALRLVRASRRRSFEAGQRALGDLLAGAVPAWRRLLDDAGAAPLLTEDGHFVAWETPATATAGRARWATTNIGTASFRDATQAELAAINALVSRPVAGAIRFEGSAQIADLRALQLALERRFADLGGLRVAGTVERIAAAQGRPGATLADGRTIAATQLLVAAGAAARPLLAPLGMTVPLVSERGYHLHATGAAWPSDMPPIAFEDRSMIVTGFASGLRVASFVEFARRDAPPDRRKWARLRASSEELGLPIGDAATEWMGARPTLPDYLPAIGRSPAIRGLFYAFGHQHLGLTLAAVTGELVADLLMGRDPQIDLAPFDLARFA